MKKKLLIVFAILCSQFLIAFAAMRTFSPKTFVGASSPQLIGEMPYKQWTRLKEDAYDWPTVSVPASTWTTVYTMPAMAVGELDVYAALAIISYDGSDASVNCDAGMCDAVIRRYVPGRYQGGDFCRPDGVCASAGSFDIGEDAYVTQAGIMNGTLARISWSGSALTVQVYCAATCRASGGISGQRMLSFLDSSVNPVDSGPVDSGPVDSGPDSGPDSGCDAGAPPTIASINVDFASAAGGETRCATGTGYATACGVTASVRVDGVSATVTSNVGTTMCWTMPASAVSATNGNGVVSVVQITAAGGTVSTTGTYPSDIWYVPAGYSGAWTAQNVTTSSGNIATVIDSSGNGYTLTPTGTAPAYSATGGGSGANLPYWTCAAVLTDYRLTNSSFPSYSAPVEWVTAALLSATPATSADLESLGPSTAGNYYDFVPNGGVVLKQYNGNVGNVVTLTSGANFWLTSLYSAGSSAIALNGGSAVTGTSPGTLSSTGGVSLGGNYGGAGNSWLGRIYQTLFYPPTGALTSTGRSNIAAYFTAKGL